MMSRVEDIAADKVRIGQRVRCEVDMYGGRKEFEGRITGVTRFGLFVKLIDTGADGLAPVSTLGDEYFIHDDKAHALVGERSGKRWRLGGAGDWLF